MPTYEYACKACDHNFEIVQSFSEDTLTTCPECEQDALRKVYNAAGIIFKGDGWHIKDYAKSSKGATSSTDTTSSSETATTEGSTKKGSSAKKDSKSSSSSGSSDSAAKPAAS